MIPSLSLPGRRALPAAVVAALALAAAPALARADATRSANWAGYAVHRTGLDFHSARASWREPAASCLSASATYSSFWVGIGGYATSSDALEQIGTELDCRADGTARASAWYELVPRASRPIRMTVAAGDRLSASVTIAGTRVTLALADATRDERFTRTITDATLDLTSAEWIAEAPSECAAVSTSDCLALPLADFGTVDFLDASARTSSGVLARPGSATLTTTRIALAGATSATANDGTSARTAVGATPSALDPASGGFTVTYAATGGGSGPPGRG